MSLEEDKDNFKKAIDFTCNTIETALKFHELTDISIFNKKVDKNLEVINKICSTRVDTTKFDDFFTKYNENPEAIKELIANTSKSVVHDLVKDKTQKSIFKASISTAATMAMADSPFIPAGDIAGAITFIGMNGVGYFAADYIGDKAGELVKNEVLNMWPKINNLHVKTENGTFTHDKENNYTEFTVKDDESLSKMLSHQHFKNYLKGDVSVKFENEEKKDAKVIKLSDIENMSNMYRFTKDELINENESLDLEKTYGQNGEFVLSNNELKLPRNDNNKNFISNEGKLNTSNYLLQTLILDKIDITSKTNDIIKDSLIEGAIKNCEIARENMKDKQEIVNISTIINTLQLIKDNVKFYETAEYLTQTIKDIMQENNVIDFLKEKYLGDPESKAEKLNDNNFNDNLENIIAKESKMSNEELHLYVNSQNFQEDISSFEKNIQIDVCKANDSNQNLNTNT